MSSSETLTSLVIRDVAVLDGTGAEPSGRHDVEIEDGRIAAIACHIGTCEDISALVDSPATVVPAWASSSGKRVLGTESSWRAYGSTWRIT